MEQSWWMTATIRHKWMLIRCISSGWMCRFTYGADTPEIHTNHSVQSLSNFLQHFHCLCSQPTYLPSVGVKDLVFCFKVPLTHWVFSSEVDWEQWAPCWKSPLYIPIVVNHRNRLWRVYLSFVEWSLNEHSVIRLLTKLQPTCWGWLTGMVGMMSNIFQYFLSPKMQWKK